MVLLVKNLPASAGDIREVGSIPGSRRTPGGGHGNPLQHSCLENPVDRGAWQATAHRVAESERTEATLHAHKQGISLPPAGAGEQSQLLSRKPFEF